MLFIDIKAGKEYDYTYEGGRLVRSAEHNVTFDEQYNVILRDYVGTIDYTYGKDGRLVKKNVYVYGASVQYFTEYPENANPIVKVKYNNQSIESHSKTDSFGRKEFEELQAGTGFISRQFMYERGKATEEHKQNGKLKSSPTTNLVKQIIFHDDRTLSYEYDKEERITKVTDSLEGVTEYTYDAQGQLLTEVKDSVTVNTMTYDNYGNILSKNGVFYEYDSVWKDKLVRVCYDGITYDAQGNPVNYLGHTLTWEKGRQLKSFGNNTYTYNANGIRTSKTVNGVKHTFMLEGSKITKEAWGENTLLPLYNNENSICGIIYNRVMYLFLKNLQGDIIAITNQNGETVARYAYDAWGKCTVTQDGSDCSIATVNPFRYRGYYYDQEIGMYYLQSRYYDPSVGRFINADAPDFVAVSGENLFSYCGNCPVKRKDLFGFCYTPTDGESAPYISDINSENKIKEIYNALVPNIYHSNRVKETTVLDCDFFKINAVGGGDVQTNGSAIIGFLLKDDEIETSLSIPIYGSYNLGLSLGRKDIFNTFTIALYSSLKVAYSSVGIKFYFSPIRFAVASTVEIASCAIYLQFKWMEIKQSLLKLLPYAILTIIIAALIYYCPYFAVAFV